MVTQTGSMRPNPRLSLECLSSGLLRENVKPQVKSPAGAGPCRADISEADGEKRPQLEGVAVEMSV